MLDKYEFQTLKEICRFIKLIYEEQEETNILLKALIKELQSKQKSMSHAENKKWKHEKCGTNIPPIFVPENPPYEI